MNLLQLQQCLYMVTIIALCLVPLPVHASTVVINEFLANNDGLLTTEQGLLLDEDGDPSDWIELHNPMDYTINLTGWFLTDREDQLDRWRFPSGIILQPNQYLIVFASGKDRNLADAPIHTNFKLDTKGEYLALIMPDGKTVAYDWSKAYPAQITNVSYGLSDQVTTMNLLDNDTRYHIPDPTDQERRWTQIDFDDSQWHQSQTDIAFGETTLEFNEDIGSPAIPGHVNNLVDNVIFTGSGAGIDGTADECHYLYTTLDGDGELIAYINYFDGPSAWAKAGVMIRESLAPEAKHVSQLLTRDHGQVFQWREQTGSSSSLTEGNRLAPPTWVRLVREGNTFFGYASEDGADWLLQSQTTIPMSHQCLIGLCATGSVSGGKAYVLFKEVSLIAGTRSRLQNMMLDQSASLWTRFSFNADEVDTLESLTLEMIYEDGFVAYLNGIEVASDNADRSMTIPAQAQTNRPDNQMYTPRSFTLSDQLDLLQEGTNVLAILGLNDQASNPDFQIIPKLWASSSRRAPMYMTQPSPGQPNISGSLGYVTDTVFNKPRGFMNKPFTLELSCATEGATIVYTTDNSAPSATHGNVYRHPIPISTTTCIRAKAIKPGWTPSTVTTHSYIFLDQVLTQPSDPPGFPQTWGSQAVDYAMDPQVVNHADYKDELIDDLLSLPTMSLVLNTDDLFGSQGIYANSNRSGVDWERPASIELFYPDGMTGFQLNCGVRIYGGVGRREQKKTFRLLFKRDYGPTKLNYPLFGPDAVDEFDTIILRAGFNNSWHGIYNQGPQYIRDEWMRRIQLDMEHPSLHGTFVHLYVNGLYWGLYNPVERCNADFGSSYLGGVKEEYDALNSYPRKVVDGTADTWLAAHNIAKAGVADQAGYEALAALVDIPNLIDYFILNFYGGNSDWDDHNWYSIRRKGDGYGWKFISWDAERVLESVNGANKTSVGQSNKPSFLYSSLKANPEFRMQFADQAHRHLFNEGVLTPAHTTKRYQELAAWVYPAVACESARWGDNKRSPARTRNHEWLNERDRLVNQYFPQRTNVVLGFLRNAGLYPRVDAPVFQVNGVSQHGGNITSDKILSMTAEGQVYYTLDGQDPRLPVVPEVSDAILLVKEEDPKTIWVPFRDINQSWYTDPDFDDTSWIQHKAGQPGGVGYERSSGYEPYISIDLLDTMSGINTGCYIRIPFDMPRTLTANLNTMVLRMRYDDGFVAYLNGHEIARSNAPSNLSWNASATGQNSDSAAITLEAFNVSAHAKHLKQGENLLAIHGLNISTSSSDMLISASLEASETQFNHEILSPSVIPYTGPIHLNESLHIKSRTLNGTTWSALNEATYVVGHLSENLRITEIMYHPQDPNAEFIEFLNIGSEPINLNLCALTRGVDFVFPSFELAPQALCLVVKDLNSFEQNYGPGHMVIGEYRGSLNNGGETIELKDALGHMMQSIKYRDSWYPITDGLGYSLTSRDPSRTELDAYSLKEAWQPSNNRGGSPGQM